MLELVLGIVWSCDGGGCAVRLASPERTIRAAYGPRVVDVIRVRPGQLVALDVSVDPPEVSWRWMVGEIVSIGEGRAALRRADVPESQGAGTSVEASVPESVRALSAGDRVFFSSFEDAREVAALATPEGVAAGRVAERWFGRITAAYEVLARET